MSNVNCGTRSKGGPSKASKYTSLALNQRCNYGIYPEIDTNKCNLLSSIGTIYGIENTFYVRKLELPSVEDWVNRPKGETDCRPCRKWCPLPSRPSTAKFCPKNECERWIWECYAYQLQILYTTDCITFPYRKSFGFSGNDGLSFIEMTYDVQTGKNMKFCGRSSCIDKQGTAVPSKVQYNIYTPNQYSYNERSKGPAGVIVPDINISNKYNIITDDIGYGIMCFDNVFYYSSFWKGEINKTLPECSSSFNPHINNQGWIFKFFFRPRKVLAPDLKELLYKMISETKCGVTSDQEIPIAFEDNCPVSDDQTATLASEKCTRIINDCITMCGPNNTTLLSSQSSSSSSSSSSSTCVPCRGSTDKFALTASKYLVEKRADLNELRQKLGKPPLKVNELKQMVKFKETENATGQGFDVTDSLPQNEISYVIDEEMNDGYDETDRGVPGMPMEEVERTCNNRNCKSCYCKDYDRCSLRQDMLACNSSGGQDCSKCQQDLNTCKQELSNCILENHVLEKELTEMTNKFNSCQTELEKCLSGDCEKDLKICNDTLNACTQLNDNYREQITNLNNEVSALKAQFAVCEQEKVGIQAQLDTCTADFQRIKEGYDQCIGDRTRCRENLTSCQSELGTTKKALNACTAQYIECTNELETTKSELVVCQNNYNECKVELQKCLDTCGSDLKKCLQEKADLEQTVTQLSSELEACNEIYNTCSENLNTCNINLNSCKLDLSTCREESEALEETNRQLSAELEASKQELRTCNDNLNTCNINLNTCNIALNKCLDEKENLESTVTQLSAELEACKEESRTCSDNLNTCNINLTACMSDKNNLTRELNACQENLGNCVDNVRSCNEDLSKCNGNLNRMTLNNPYNHATFYIIYDYYKLLDEIFDFLPNSELTFDQQRRTALFITDVINNALLPFIRKNDAILKSPNVHVQNDIMFDDFIKTCDLVNTYIDARNDKANINLGNMLFQSAYLNILANLLWYGDNYKNEELITVFNSLYLVDVHKCSHDSYIFNRKYKFFSDFTRNWFLSDNQDPLFLQKQEKRSREDVEASSSNESNKKQK